MFFSDMQKIKKDFDVNAKGYLELSDFANTQLKSTEKWSLKGLAMNLVSTVYIQ
jgi:hypothetical protein